MDILLNLKGLYHKVKKSNCNFKINQERLKQSISTIPDWQKSLIEREFTYFNHLKNNNMCNGVKKSEKIKNAIQAQYQI